MSLLRKVKVKLYRQGKLIRIKYDNQEIFSFYAEKDILDNGINNYQELNKLIERVIARGRKCKVL
jgi:hypothetical protein